MNTVVQGSAADIIKVAMLRVHEWLKKANLRARLLLQIHDELLFECHPEDLAALTAGTIERMAGAIELSVPLKVDTKAGRTWADCT